MQVLCPRILAVLIGSLGLYACHNSPNTSATGALGQACYSNRTCNNHLRCNTHNLCESCTPGSQGCTCAAQNTCDNPFSCSSGLCQRRSVPLDAHCYTPCEQSYTDSQGIVHTCGPDKLMDGCVAGATCEQGRCASASIPKTTCQTDLECPEHQACVNNTCASVCDTQSDCTPSETCYKHVCRISCTTTPHEAPCPQNTHCITEDGTTGACMPLSPQSTQLSLSGGSFSVDQNTLTYSPNTPSNTLTITNNTDETRVFTFNKVSQTVYNPNTQRYEANTSNPLAFLTVRNNNRETRERTFTFTVPAQGSTTLTLQTQSWSSYGYSPSSGEISISEPNLGTRTVLLRSISTHAGRWTGHKVSFAYFPTEGLESWLSNKNDLQRRNNVRNALFQKWQLVKQTNGLDGLNEWFAVLSATQHGSWKSPALKRYCPSPTQACYLYENDFGFSTYSSDTSAFPIPTGASVLPVAFNIREESNQNASVYQGIQDSSVALFQSGNASVSLSTFSTIPGACSQNNEPCLSILSTFTVRSNVGPRYFPTDSDTDCSKAYTTGARPDTFKRLETPSLLPGFTSSTVERNGQRYSTQCVGHQNPWGQNEKNQRKNMLSASVNSETTGFPLKRTLTLIDGAILADNTLFVLYKETFETARTPANTSVSYGYMLLTKQETDTQNNSFFQSEPPVDTPSPTLSMEQKGCTEETLQKALNTPNMPNDPVPLINVLLNGNTPEATPQILPNYHNNVGYSVHYYCEDTGTIDKGPFPNTDPVECPIESRVVYFTARNFTDQMAAQLDCQQSVLRNNTIPRNPITSTPLLKGTCNDTLTSWLRTRTMDTRTDIGRRCKDPSLFYCDTNRSDLLAQQEFFFLPTNHISYFDPIQTSIRDAFRYKFRFAGRQNNTVGFTPVLCSPHTDTTPYCYNPEEIEELEDRIACLEQLYVQNYGRLENTSLGDKLKEFLTYNFSYKDIANTVSRNTHGFEYAYAELMVMLGDESLTQSYASRFDSAQTSLGVFHGELFEPEGVTLSGALGAEMIHLYQSTQYYQKVLDRFQRIRYPVEYLISRGEPSALFVGQKTASSYVLKAVRASTQKSKAFSEIARRYHRIGKPDIARGVIERAYEGTFLESITLNYFLKKVHDREKPLAQSDVLNAIYSAQQAYNSALLEMYETYQALSIDTTIAGFSPDYIPFPSLDSKDAHAFSKIIRSAHEKLDLAQRKEENAIAYSKSYNVDASSFESELYSIRSTYENELSAVCGSFTHNGRVYPAIVDYAYLTSTSASLGNPCGLLGTGSLNQAMGEVDVALAGLKSTQARGDALVQNMHNEAQRINQQCNLYMSIADYEYRIGSQISNAQKDILAWSQNKERISHIESFASNIANHLQCFIGVTGTDCGGALAAAAVKTVAFAIARTELDDINQKIFEKQNTAHALENALARWKTQSQCDFARIDSDARMKSLLIELQLNSIETIRSEYVLRLALANVQSLSNKAQALAQQYQEALQLTLNAAASKNDPNVRIYKNDAILAADRTFNDALREAYRATLVYEYYTSQTYAKKGDLYLTRMVAHGDHSLEAYLAELEESFYTFEEYFGKPDLRVAIVSLRDDILHIPRTDNNGTPLSIQSRVESMREKLQHHSSYNAQGVLSLPFSTRFESVSPLTRNHKIVAIEAEIIGSNVGDTLGRVYVVQSGTSSVSNFNKTRNYYLFAPKPSVINTFFNGSKPLASDVYKNDRLRDRPYINTEWRLMLNQRDESVNQDIQLNTVTDIRLYIYYSDFTDI